jgi:hypothetical protein
VTREGIRPIAALVAVVFAAAVLAACGGSDSTATDSASTAGSPSQGQSQSGGSGGSKGSAGESESGSSAGSHGSGDVATPLKVSGGGSEQFRTKGGDNSIQEFGEESDESELEAAAEAVHGFFVARAEGDWAGACTYLSKAMTDQLKQLAASSTELKDKGCASFLEAFTSPLSDAAWREITTVDAGSLRDEGEQAFLIYYGAPKKTVYAMPLVEEDGKWKVGALSGDALG